MEAYEQAGEWYAGEDSNAYDIFSLMFRQASACFLKAAQFSATLEQYDRAINVFESVAEKSLGNNLTKWSVREYLLKAGICVLCTQANSIFLITRILSELQIVLKNISQWTLHFLVLVNVDFWCL